MESWYRNFCPFCNAVNWYCNGDESDLTVLDVEAVKCWSCKKTWSTENENEIIENDDTYVYVVDGVSHK